MEKILQELQKHTHDITVEQNKIIADFHGQTYVCPKCRRKVIRKGFTEQNVQRYRCNSCRKSYQAQDVVYALSAFHRLYELRDGTQVILLNVPRNVEINIDQVKRSWDV